MILVYTYIQQTKVNDSSEFQNKLLLFGVFGNM